MLRLVLDLLGLDDSRLCLVLHVLLLLNGLGLLGLLRNVLRVCLLLLLDMLLRVLRVLLRVLRMLRVLMLRRVLLVLLLRRVLRDGHGRLNRAWVLLVMLLSRLIILAVVDGFVAAIHVGLGLRMAIMLLAVPGCISSEWRLVLCLHRYRGWRLRRP